MANPPSEAFRDATSGPMFVQVSITLCVVCLLLVSYSFAFVHQRRGYIGVEEVMVLCSLITLIFITVIGCEAIRNGFGHHSAVIASIGGNLKAALMFFWIYQIFYKVAICFNKLAMLTLYLRVFVEKSFQRICWTTVGVVLAGTLSFVIATTTECLPVELNWNKTIHGKCVNNSALRWSWAGFNTMTDIWVALLPISCIWKLQMSTSKKVGVLIVFALGLFTCVTSAVRMQALVQSTTKSDVTFDSTTALIWSQVEASTGLICTRLPSLKPLFSRCFPKLKTQRSTSYRPPGRTIGGSYRLRDLSNAVEEQKVDYFPGSLDKDTTHITLAAMQAESEEGYFSSAGRESQEHIVVKHAGIVVRKDFDVRSDTPARFEF